MNETPLAGTSADLNLDGLTNAGDWQQFLAHSYTSLLGVSALQAFQRGDLDLDGDNDQADFRFFKSAYTAINGAGAFAALLGVPEPSGIGIFAIAATFAGGARRRKQS